MAALEYGNQIRSQRAALKRDLKARKTTLVAILQNPPEYILKMKLYDLVMAQRQVGRAKTKEIMTKCHISPVKTIGGLTDRQRNEILDHLQGKTKEPEWLNE